MNPRATTDWLVRAAALVVLLGGLKLATPLVVPLLLAVFLAIVSAPLMMWLVRHGVHRFVAVAAALSADVAFFGAMAALAASGLNAFVSALPRYQARVGTLKQEASVWLADQGLPDLGDLLPSAWTNDDMGHIVAAAIAELARALSSLALVLLVVAFVLVELLGIEDKLRLVFKHPEIGIEQFRRAAAHVQRYIVVKTGANALTGGLVWLWLAAFRVDFAMLWGVCAFMLSYVPTLGSVLLAAPVMMVTLLQYGFGTTVVVGTGYVLINTAIAALVEPRVFGQALGLSPLVVFVSMVCWGWLWGPVGAVLSVPLTVVVKIILAYVDGYEWLSRMLGPAQTMQGVGTPSIPPGVLTTLPQSAVITGAGITLTGNPDRASSSALQPVMIPTMPSVGSTRASSSSLQPVMMPASPPAAALSSMGPMIPTAPSFGSVPPPPPAADDDLD